MGCSEEYLDLNQLEVARGRWFSRNDDGDNVIVLADRTAKRLFPYENPIGKTVRMPTRYRRRRLHRDWTDAIPRSLGRDRRQSEARDYNMDAYIPWAPGERRVGDFVMWRIRAASRARWSS